MSGWTDALVQAQMDRLKHPPVSAEIQLCITCAGACDKSTLRSVQAVCSECGNHGIVWLIPRPTAAPAKAKGRIPWSPKMNGTERAYDAYLRTLYSAGEILWWDFEPIRIVIGPGATYTPDFLVLYRDGTLELLDTKGTLKIKSGRKAGEKTYWAEEHAVVKAKVVTASFPIPLFYVFSLGDGAWGKRGFGGRHGDTNKGRYKEIGDKPS